MTTTKTEPTMEQMVASMKARQRMGRLEQCQDFFARFTDRELEVAKVRIELRPDFKALLQEVCYDRHESMADFVRVAVHERLCRVLADDITAGGM